MKKNKQDAVQPEGVEQLVADPEAGPGDIPPEALKDGEENE